MTHNEAAREISKLREKLRHIGILARGARPITWPNPNNAPQA